MLKRFVANTIKYPLVFIFTATLLIFFAGYIFMPQEEYSEVENRYLQIRPEISMGAILDGSYMKDFEEYTLAQLPLRESFVRVKAVASQLLGMLENKGIARGKEGQLFAKNTSASARLYKNMATIAEFIEHADRDVYVAVAPTAELVLDSKIPTGMPYIDEKICQDEFDEIMSGLHNYKKIDISSKLINHKDEYLYYKTDHHWTTNGAYYAYEQIAEALGKEPVKRENLSEHEIKGFYGTHFAKFKGLGIEPDTILYYDIPIGSLYCDGQQFDSLYDISKADAYDKYAVFMHGNYGISEVEGNLVKDGSQLIVFKDSYANSLIPFLCCNYESIIVIDLRYYGENVADLLKDNKKADILMLYNWLFINEDNHFYKLIS